jgi:hypothetical protein
LVEAIGAGNASGPVVTDSLNEAQEQARLREARVAHSMPTFSG